jgi:hypothetical protein
LFQLSLLRCQDSQALAHHGLAQLSFANAEPVEFSKPVGKIADLPLYRLLTHLPVLFRSLLPPVQSLYIGFTIGRVPGFINFATGIKRKTGANPV